MVVIEKNISTTDANKIIEIVTQYCSDLYKEPETKNDTEDEGYNFVLVIAKAKYIK